MVKVSFLLFVVFCNWNSHVSCRSVACKTSSTRVVGVKSGASLEWVNGCNCIHRFWEKSNCTHLFWSKTLDFDNFHAKMGLAKKPFTHRLKFLKKALQITREKWEGMTGLMDLLFFDKGRRIDKKIKYNALSRVVIALCAAVAMVPSAFTDRFSPCTDSKQRRAGTMCYHDISQIRWSNDRG